MMNDENSVLQDLLQQIEDDYTEEQARLKSSESILTNDTDEILELGDSFDFEGFQVVRREFFAHLREPSVTFNNCKFSVNSACIAKFPNTDHVQVLVNPETKTLALRPCEEGARDSFSWCNVSKGKRKPRAITCKLFFAKIVDMMGWNPNYRYKMLGRIVHSNDDYLIAFDLSATEVYQRSVVEGQKVKNSRTPVFPAEWQDQFGLPFNEHNKSMQVNIFDGYAVYAIKENSSEYSTPFALVEPNHVTKGGATGAI